jgi:two-component system, cell cycle sensor histidine kinase and response regulator CckA
VARNSTTDAGKLAALQQEASRIGHDFNNLLTVISGHSSLLATAVSASDPMRSSVAEIQKAADRAGVLAQQLLDLSKQKP